MTAVIRPRLQTFHFFTCNFVFLIYTAASANAASITGRVVDPDGRPVVNAEIIVSGSTATPLRARTDGEGKFSLDGLDAGRYSVLASAPGLVIDATAIDVASTPSTIEITMKITAISVTLLVS